MKEKKKKGLFLSLFAGLLKKGRPKEKNINAAAIVALGSEFSKLREWEESQGHEVLRPGI
jgi:hypothetical protein